MFSTSPIVSIGVHLWKLTVSWCCYYYTVFSLLPACASEQGNVIVSVRVSIYMSSKKFVIERTRDLIYLKFVATDFSLKIISPSAGKNSGDSA